MTASRRRERIRASPHLYVRDLATGRTSLVSVNAAGTDASNGFTNGPGRQFTADGSRIAYVTDASDLGRRTATATSTCISRHAAAPAAEAPPTPTTARALSGRTVWSAGW